MGKRPTKISNLMNKKKKSIESCYKINKNIYIYAGLREKFFGVMYIYIEEIISFFKRLTEKLEYEQDDEDLYHQL